MVAEPNFVEIFKFSHILKSPRAYVNENTSFGLHGAEKMGGMNGGVC